MIKKVVLKENIEYPEFDAKKVYIYRDLFHNYFKLIENNYHDFELISFGSNSNRVFARFPNFKEVCKWSEKNPIYVLESDANIVQFIQGFLTPPVLDFSLKDNKLKSDEVSVDAVSSKKLYAFKNANGVRQFCCGPVSKQVDEASLDRALRLCIKSAMNSETIYQFDNQEEYFKWTLEHLTHKKFTKIKLPFDVVGTPNAFSVWDAQYIEALI